MSVLLGTPTSLGAASSSSVSAASSVCGTEVLSSLCTTSWCWKWTLRLRWLFVFVAVATPCCLVWLAPKWGIVGTPLFVAVCTAVVMQTLVLVAPKLLWFQFEQPVVWADVNSEPFARNLVLFVCNAVTVVGAGVCCTLLARRYHMGDLASMATVTEIASTLFLLKQVQRSAGRPALALATWLIRRKQRQRNLELIARPHLVVVWNESRV